MVNPKETRGQIGLYIVYRGTCNRQVSSSSDFRVLTEFRSTVSSVYRWSPLGWRKSLSKGDIREFCFFPKYIPRTVWWNLAKLCMNEVLMVPYKSCFFSARHAKDPEQDINRSKRDRKAIATNRMQSNDLKARGKKCCYLWFHSEVHVLTYFDVFLDLIILTYSNAISIDFYAVKCLINIHFE